MSKPIGPITVAPGLLATPATNQYPDANVAVFINESPYTLLIDPGTGSYYVISAFMQDAIILGNQYSGQLKITARADLIFTGSAPISVLYIITYAKGEQVPGTYPAALPRLMSVGNPVTTSGSVNSLNNQNETPPVDVIFDQPTGYSAPSIHLIDTAELHLAPKGNASQQDALAVIPGAGSGVYAVVQLDNALIATDGQGNLSAKHLAITQLANTGTSSLDNGTITTDGTGLLDLLKNLAASNVDYLKIAPADTPSVEFDFFILGASDSSLDIHDIGAGSSAVQLLGAKGIKSRARGNYRGPWSRFTGSGSGTYSHGLGVAPNHITPIVNVAGSATQGFDTVTSTQVHITLGAALSFSAEATVLQ